jgi:hypothetical protein
LPLAAGLAVSAVGCGGGSGTGDAGTVPVTMPDGAADGARACETAPPATVDLHQALTDPEVRGTCACEGSTLGEVLGELWIANPELSDVTTLAGDGYMDAPGLVFAFATPQGFRIIMKRGWGDCQAGCPSNEFWYFETDAGCLAQPVGHFRASVDDVGGRCYVLEGEPLWNFIPQAPACPAM